MVEVAAHLEFFMLDPVFAELLELTEPGRTGHHREAYARHVEQLVGAIERNSSADPLARFLARVLKRALRDNVSLAAYATHDPLTGLFNRRGLISHLKQWISWAYRYERPLMVLLVDVDEFKGVNDDHGHAVGDYALECIARALQESTRMSDLIARYGGDEFAIVAPETDAEEYSALVQAHPHQRARYPLPQLGRCVRSPDGECRWSGALATWSALRASHRRTARRCRFEPLRGEEQRAQQSRLAGARDRHRGRPVGLRRPGPTQPDAWSTSSLA
jgi:GGDEF domain-containing protein